jgi:23S rRNA pseudouridine2605 synthase
MVEKMPERLNKVLASCGLGSRRSVEKLIFAGKVFVNGTPVLLPQVRVEEKDAISVNGCMLSREVAKKKFYFLLNKPIGYICSNQRLNKEKIILDLLPQKLGRLFCIGRLDKLTSGLLIVTNDGNLAQHIMHPSFEVSKEYLVRVREDLSSEHLALLSQGMHIENSFVRPERVVKVRKGTMKISVKEGKKHEIRLLVAKAELTLLELKRIRIGSLLLGSLPPGVYREMSLKEIEPFLKTLPKKRKTYSCCSSSSSSSSSSSFSSQF